MKLSYAGPATQDNLRLPGKLKVQTGVGSMILLALLLTFHPLRIIKAVKLTVSRWEGMKPSPSERVAAILGDKARYARPAGSRGKCCGDEIGMSAR